MQPIVRAGGAKSFRSHARGGLVSGEWATGLQWAAAPAPRTNAGSSRAGPLRELCASVFWFAWLPVGSGRSGGKHKRGGWASRGPTHPCPSKNKFGNECCLLRQRGRPLTCRRFLIFPELFLGGASTCLKAHCSEIACIGEKGVSPSVLTDAVWSVVSIGNQCHSQNTKTGETCLYITEQHIYVPALV